MSSTARLAAPARRAPAAAPTQAPQRRLRLVLPLPRKRIPFPLVCVGLLVLGLLGVLLANIYISHSTYRVQQLTSEQQALNDQRARVAEDIAYRSSPQNVQAAAKSAGMVRATDPEFIRKSDGAVISAEKAKEISGKNGQTVPGPRADTREDPKPNLRSGDKLPAVGGSSRSTTTFDTPTIRTPGK